MKTITNLGRIDVISENNKDIINFKLNGKVTFILHTKIMKFLLRKPLSTLPWESHRGKSVKTLGNF